MFDIDYDIDELKNEITSLETQLQQLKNTLKTNRINKAGKGTLKECDSAADVTAIPNVGFEYKLTLTGHFGKIYTLHWSPVSGNTLLSASQDGTMIVWNALRGLKNQIVKLDCQWVMACSFSSSGNLTAAGGLDNNIAIYPVQPGRDDTQCIKLLQHHDGYVSSIRFLSEDKVVTSSGDATCILWDTTAETPSTIFAEHLGDVMSVSIASPNTFFSGATDQVIKFWDIRAKRCVRTLEGHDGDVNSVVSLADGNAVATGSDDNTCRLFDVRCWSQLNVYSSDDTQHAVSCVDVSKSGRLLFAGYDDHNVHIFDVITGAKVSPVLDNQHDNRVACLAFNREGHALATGSWDEKMKIWA